MMNAAFLLGVLGVFPSTALDKAVAHADLEILFSEKQIDDERRNDAMDPQVRYHETRGFRSYFGLVDVGLNAETVRDPAAVQETIQSLARDILIRTGYSGAAAPLVLRQYRPDVLGRVLYEFDQAIGETLFDSDSIVVTFNRDGSMRTLVGSPIDTEGLPHHAVDLTLEEFSRIFDLLGDSGEMSVRVIAERDHGYLYEVNDGSDTRVLITPEFDRLDWTNEAPLNDNRNCNIRHTIFTKNAGGYTTSLVNTNGTQIDVSNCEGDNPFFTGTCYWELRSTHYADGLHRMEDETTTTQPQDPGSCTATPTFTLSTGTAFRQQDAYYFLNQTRSYINQNVWANIPPDFGKSTDIYPITNANLASGVLGSYSTSSHELKIDSSAVNRPMTMAHEYGHHAAWTFGLSAPSGCTANVSEGRAVHEMMGDAFSMIFAADEGVLKTALNANIDLQATTQHLVDGDISVDTSNGCSPSFIVSSSGFLQAIWEILYGRDCTANTCDVINAYGSAIWGTGVTQEEAIETVGTYLGNALASTPDNPDVVDVTLAFRDQVLFLNATTRANINSVLAHHGR